MMVQLWFPKQLDLKSHVLMCAWKPSFGRSVTYIYYPLLTKYVTVSIDWDGLVGLEGIMVIVGFRKGKGFCG